MFVQIVQFKLKSDASRVLFLNLTQRMLLWLQARPGFVAYELYEGDAYWSDRITWKDQASAQNGQADFLTTTIAAQLTPLVAESHSSFFGQAVMTAE